VHGQTDRLGKPANRDAELGVPNAVLLMGEAEARRRFQELVEQSVAVLPSETDNSEVRGTILALARRIATGTRARPAA
jgi:hypothetical protein